MNEKKLKLYVGRINPLIPRGWWWEIAPEGSRSSVQGTFNEVNEAGMEAWGARIADQPTALQLGLARLSELQHGLREPTS